MLLLEERRTVVCLFGFDLTFGRLGFVLCICVVSITVVPTMLMATSSRLKSVLNEMFNCYSVQFNDCFDVKSSEFDGNGNYTDRLVSSCVGIRLRKNAVNGKNVYTNVSIVERACSVRIVNYKSELYFIRWLPKLLFQLSSENINQQFSNLFLAYDSHMCKRWKVGSAQKFNRHRFLAMYRFPC